MVNQSLLNTNKPNKGPNKGVMEAMSKADHHHPQKKTSRFFHGISLSQKKPCQGGALPLLARLEAALPGGPGDLQHSFGHWNPIGSILSVGTNLLQSISTSPVKNWVSAPLGAQKALLIRLLVLHLQLGWGALTFRTKSVLGSAKLSDFLLHLHTDLMQQKFGLIPICCKFGT